MRWGSIFFSFPPFSYILHLRDTKQKMAQCDIQIRERAYIKSIREGNRRTAFIARSQVASDRTTKPVLREPTVQSRGGRGARHVKEEPTEDVTATYSNQCLSRGPSPRFVRLKFRSYDFSVGPIYATAGRRPGCTGGGF